MITEDVIIAAAKGIETADLEGEAVLLDINTGLYYGLSRVPHYDDAKGTRSCELDCRDVAARV